MADGPEFARANVFGRFDAGTSVSVSCWVLIEGSLGTPRDADLALVDCGVAACV